MNIKKLFTFLFALLISCFSSVALALTPTGYSPTVPQALCRTATNSWTFCNGADVFGAGTTMTSPVLNSPVINNPSGALFSNPTLYSSSVDSKGGLFNGDFEVGTGDESGSGFSWIGSESYGFGKFRGASTTGGARYNTAKTYSGKQSMELYISSSGLSNLVWIGLEPSLATSAPTVPFLSKYAIRIKPSTSYRISFDWAGSGLATNQAQFRYKTYLSDSTLSLNYTTNGTPTDFTKFTTNFTSGANDAYLLVEWHNGYTGFTPTAGSLYIDNVKIQEVSSLTPTNTLPETMGGIFQAQNTTATDQSQLNTNEVRAFGNDTRNIIAQQFTVSKTKQYGVTIYKAGNTGTFVNDVIASIQSDSGSDTPSGTVLSKITIPNATWNSYATGDPIRIVFPYIVTPGVKYWVTLEQTTPDASNYPAIQSNNPASSYAGGLLKGYLPSTWTTIDADLKFFTEYSRLSEGMTVVSNGIETNLMASSKDGLLGGSILDLDRGKWNWTAGSVRSATNGTEMCANVYDASAGGSTSTDSALLNGWQVYRPSNITLIQTANNNTPRYITFKVNTILPIKNILVTLALYNGGAVDKVLQVSENNVDWTTIATYNINGTSQKIVTPINDIKGSLFYLRVYKGAVSDRIQIDEISIEADIDTSSIPLPTIYPLAVNQFNAQIKTSTAPARAYYRLNKYVNENNVMMPAIELTDSSGNPLGFGTVKQDNSQEASPVLNLLSSSTGYQQSGTGSSVTGGYLLNDGEYMTLTGTNYNFEIDYQLGTGTTAISAITKNIAYLSSNSSLADATLDASLMANFFLSVKQQGLSSAIGGVREDIQDVRGELTDVNEELDRLNGTMFIQTANQTIENTTTETSMFDGGVGSRVIPAHSLKVGDTFSMRLMGYLSGTNGDNATVKIKFGSSELVSNTSTMPATITDVYTELYYQCTVRSIGSAGTAMCQGRTMLNAGVGLATTYLRGLQMTSPVAINTETDNLIDSTYTWGTASAGNSLKVTNAVLELIKQ